MTMMYEWLNREKARYYKIMVDKTKLNEITLHYNWGSCSSKRGGNKNLLVQTEEEVMHFINKMMARRKRRGYDLIAPING